MKDVIEFSWFGLHLQEPMAGIMNILISIVCFFSWVKLKKWNNPANYWWRIFYLAFGISTVFGAMGHVFFQYWGIPGKFPCWIMGTIATMSAGKGMLAVFPYAKPKPWSDLLILIKSVILLTLALLTQKFLYITIDAIITYIAYTGIFASILSKRGASEMRWMVIGTLVLLPSAFVFLLKLSPHRWFNKDDVSHLLMIGCIICFYVGLNKWGIRQAGELKNVE